MESIVAAILALAGTLLSGFATRSSSKDIQEQQNQHNEEMYLKYHSPQAQARQLSEAGMSDSAIAQAISGVGGSSINLTSAPSEPLRFDGFAENLSSLIGSRNTEEDTENKKVDRLRLRELIRGLGLDNALKGNELILAEETLQYLIESARLDVDLKEGDLELQNLDKGIKKSMQESVDADVANKLADLHLKDIEYRKGQRDIKLKDLELKEKGLDLKLKEVELYVQEHTKDYQIEFLRLSIAEKFAGILKTDAEIDKMCAEVLWLDAQLDALQDLEDVRQKDAAEARFYKNCQETLGIPYDVAKSIVSGVSEHRLKKNNNRRGVLGLLISAIIRK